MLKKVLKFVIVGFLLASSCGCALLSTALSAAAGYAIYQATHK